MPKQETLIRAAVASLGVGASVALYRGLKNADNPLRDKVLEFVAEKSGFNRVRDSEEAVDSFCQQLPGPRLASALTADILAQPKTVWTEADIRRVSLSPEVNDDFERGFTSYIQVKPADQNHFPRLFILKEHGWPYSSIKVPFTDYDLLVATVRTFLVGQKHVPKPLLPPIDTSTY
jgi:hypothetical protein